MNEEFLHYLWKFRLLDSVLRTTSGEELVILHPGEHNRDGGPDFFNARIRIGGTTWAGNVEIHVNASDWYRHGHEKDSLYDNIILHAVFKNDVAVYRNSGEAVPTLEMNGHFPGGLFDRYRDFLENRNWIPCGEAIGESDPLLFGQYVPALAVERFEERTTFMKKILESGNFDWDEAFYRSLARAFGFRINAQPFELLAVSLPWKLLQKHRDSLFRLEALMFGQAGMLRSDFSEEYPIRLRDEYRFLSAKYGLTALSGSLWKFLRLRPSNFPTLRIAQLAALVHRSADLLQSVLEAENPDRLTALFEVNASEYWDTHFIFGRLSSPKKKSLGITSIRLLIINLVAPFLFLYGDVKAASPFREKAISFLEQLPPEMNSGIEPWKAFGIPVPDALHTQALLYLKKNYCDTKRCLECRIGKQLLQR